MVKRGTGHAVVENDGDDSNNEAVVSLNLEKDGIPTREEFLKNMGYTNLNVSSGLLQEKNVESTSWADFV